MGSRTTRQSRSLVRVLVTAAAIIAAVMCRAAPVLGAVSNEEAVRFQSRTGRNIRTGSGGKDGSPGSHAPAPSSNDGPGRGVTTDPKAPTGAATEQRGSGHGSPGGTNPGSGTITGDTPGTPPGSTPGGGSGTPPPAGGTTGTGSGPGTGTTPGDPPTEPTPVAVDSADFATDGGLTGTVTPDGPTLVRLNGQTVATGSWSAFNGTGYFNEQTAGQLALGPIVSKRLVVSEANRFLVSHTYQEATVAYAIEAEGEDLKVAATFTNHSADQPVSVPGFKGLTLQFPEPPKGRLPSWYYTYTQRNYLSVVHPSYSSPVGAWFLTGSSHGVSMVPIGACLKRKLFLADYDAAIATQPTRKLIYLYDDSIAPGQTKTVRIQLRFSPNTDWRYLLEPYKRDYDATMPPVQYLADARPMVYSVSAAAEHVTADNPYGFNAPRDRFDLDAGDRAGVRVYLKQVGDPLQAVNGQGVIFWTPQGWNKRGAMYRPDFDVYPPEILKNIPTLFAGLQARGLTAGQLARPSEVVVPRGDIDVTSSFGINDTERVDETLRRFDNAIDMGVTTFYLDCFGNRADDLQLMQKYRGRMKQRGNIVTYAEYVTDTLLPYTGVYVEVAHTPAKGYHYRPVWLNEQLMEIFRWLSPGMAVVCQNYAEGRPHEEAWEWCYQRKIVPLLPGWMVAGKATAIRGLNDRYIDAATRWWRGETPPAELVRERQAAVEPMYD